VYHEPACRLCIGNSGRHRVKAAPTGVAWPGGRHAKCEHVAGIPSGYRRLPGSERGAPSEAELIGPVPAAVPVRVTVVPRPA